MMDTDYLGYARRGLTTWWRYPVAACLGVLLAIVMGALGLLIAGLLHLTPPDLATQVQHPDHPATFFLTTAFMFGLMIVGFALAIRWLHRKRFGDVLGAWTWRQYLLGFGVWIPVLVVTALIDLALAPSGFKFTGGTHLVSLTAMALAALAIQTFAEEFVFRGYLTQGLLLATKQPLVAALISGLLFGSIHIPNGVPQAASATVFGVVMALIAIRTGGIAFTSGLHLANNLFAAVVLVSSNDAFKGSPGLFSQDTPQLMWWDAVAGGIALALVAFVLMWRRRAIRA